LIVFLLACFLRHNSAAAAATIFSLSLLFFPALFPVAAFLLLFYDFSLRLRRLRVFDAASEPADAAAAAVAICCAVRTVTFLLPLPIPFSVHLVCSFLSLL
jgi:hypothetical protein